MKVEIRTASEEFWENHDYREFFEVVVDGTTKISCMDGEPEDNNLMRNFSSIRNVRQLMELSYAAGQRGEELSIDEVEVDEP